MRLRRLKRLERGGRMDSTEVKVGMIPILSVHGFIIACSGFVSHGRKRSDQKAEKCWTSYTHKGVVRAQESANMVLEEKTVMLAVARRMAWPVERDTVDLMGIACK
jgi:hypothetical protein